MTQNFGAVAAVGGECFESGVDGDEVTVVRADDGREDVHGVREVQAFLAVGHVHQDVAAGLELSEIADLGVDFPGPGAAAGDDVAAEATAEHGSDDLGDSRENFFRDALAFFESAGMGADDGIGLNAAEFEVFRLVDLFGDGVDAVFGKGSGTVVADVDVDENFEFTARDSGGFVVPSDLMRVVDDYHGSGSRGSGHFEGVRERRGQENAGDSSLGHQLGFGDSGDADSNGSSGDLTFGDLRALVRLGVGTQGLAGFLDPSGHAGDVRFE